VTTQALQFASSCDDVLESSASQFIIRNHLLQVTSAFFGSDFVTVSKTEDCPWAVLKPDVFAAIMDHFSSGEPLFTDASAAASDTAINDDDTEVWPDLHRDPQNQLLILTQTLALPLALPQTLTRTGRRQRCRLRHCHSRQ